MGNDNPTGRGMPAGPVDASANDSADTYFEYEKDPITNEFADHCRLEGYRLIELVIVEEGEDTPDANTSDLMIAAYAKAANEFRNTIDPDKGHKIKQTVVDGHDFHPTELFLGISLILFDTPINERPPFLNNMARYLANRYPWGDLPHLYLMVLMPTVAEFAHLAEKEDLNRQLLDQAAEYAMAVCVVADDVFCKLRDLPYSAKGPVTQQLWDGLRGVIRNIRELSDKSLISTIKPLKRSEVELVEIINKRRLSGAESEKSKPLE